jgi:hypothetical protein
MLCFGTKTSNAAMGWLVVIICGALMYASNDLQFSIQGYLWSFAHIISMTFYLTLVKRISSSSQPVPPALSSLLNNLTFLPILLLSVSRQTFVFVSVQMPSSSSPSPPSSSSSNASSSSSVPGELPSFIASSVTCLQSSPHKVLLPLILSCVAGNTLEYVPR